MTNTRNRKLAPARPYIFLHCPDDEVVTAVPTAIIWSCCPIKTSELHYECGDDRVIVSRGGAGMYEIYASISVEKKTGAPTHSVIQVYVNGTVACCADTHGFIGSNAGQHSNAVLLYTVYLSEGDYVQIYASQTVGTGTIEHDTGRFRMKGLSMRGWNNRLGGRKDIRDKVVM